MGSLRLHAPGRLFIGMGALLGMSIAGCSGPADGDSAPRSSAPAASRLIAEALPHARELAPIPASARERIQRDEDGSWQASMVTFDLGQRVEVSAPPSAERPMSGSDALEQARPAPMPREPTTPPAEEGRASPTPVGSGTVDSGSSERPGHAESGGSAPSRGEGQPTPAPGSRTTSIEAYRVLSHFEVDGTDLYFTGEASPLGANRFLTAAHCLYQHDPNGDGDDRDACWATDVWILPVSETEDGPAPEIPAARAASRISAHQSWISRRADEFDIGVVTVGAGHSTRGPPGSRAPHPADGG